MIPRSGRKEKNRRENTNYYVRAGMEAKREADRFAEEMTNINVKIDAAAAEAKKVADMIETINTSYSMRPYKSVGYTAASLTYGGRPMVTYTMPGTVSTAATFKPDYSYYPADVPDDFDWKGQGFKVFTVGDTTLYNCEGCYSLTGDPERHRSLCTPEDTVDEWS